MSQTKVKSGLLNFTDQTDFVKLPSGTTAQRPVDAPIGAIRYNTDEEKVFVFNGLAWLPIGPDYDFTADAGWISADSNKTIDTTKY